MNIDIQHTDLQVQCEVHGNQIVQRIKSIDGLEFNFDHTPECPACCIEQNAAKEREQDERRKLERVQHLITAAQPPRRHEGTTFDDYTTTSSAQKRILEICRRYTNNIASQGYPGWLALSGRPGTGKTMLLSCIAVDLAKNHVRSRYTTQAAMGREFRATYQRGAERSETSLFDYYAQIPLLLLDELGASSTEHTDRLVFEVLDTRYANNLPVVIATNHPRAALQEVVGERLFDRLTEEATFLAFDWESNRKPAGLRNKNRETSPARTDTHSS
ncbi:MAG TPA: ATP-binding protein [Dyella sp.]|uniref:ATP-binding protein n=1 Tax=Dyella sp. TaxID=1869338 RepID=UPI002B951506|nr:ATP-binding protein [Dyella sp.]HUB91109.1 ATP-binding protein [Dyella sp.]